MTYTPVQVERAYAALHVIEEFIYHDELYAEVMSTAAYESAVVRTAAEILKGDT